jgi:hypothetical protein
MNRTVYLDADGDGAKGVLEVAVTSDAGGEYTFTNLGPGPYVVRQVVPAGWSQTRPAGAHAVTVVSGVARSGRDFASRTTGSVSGKLFDDQDFDGSAFTVGDDPLAGRTVYADLDADGALDADEPTAATDAGGAYTLAGLAPGVHVVRPVVPAGRACSFPATCAYTVTVTSRSSTTDQDFGSYAGAGVSGHLFEDLDADGQPAEPGEGPLAGRRVYLDADADAAWDAGEPAALSDAAGDYTFTGVVARGWDVRVETGAGWSCDRPSPCRHTVALTSGSSHGGKDFGLHTTGSISGHLFTDRDNDGAPQAFGENDQPRPDGVPRRRRRREPRRRRAGHRDRRPRRLHVRGPRARDLPGAPGAPGGLGLRHARPLRAHTGPALGPGGRGPRLLLLDDRLVHRSDVHRPRRRRRLPRAGRAGAGRAAGLRRHGRERQPRRR